MTPALTLQKGHVVAHHATHCRRVTSTICFFVSFFAKNILFVVQCLLISILTSSFFSFYKHFIKRAELWKFHLMRSESICNQMQLNSTIITSPHAVRSVFKADEISLQKSSYNLRRNWNHESGARAMQLIRNAAVGLDAMIRVWCLIRAALLFCLEQFLDIVLNWVYISRPTCVHENTSTRL